MGTRIGHDYEISTLETLRVPLSVVHLSKSPLFIFESNKQARRIRYLFGETVFKFPFLLFPERFPKEDCTIFWDNRCVCVYIRVRLCVVAVITADRAYRGN